MAAALWSACGAPPPLTTAAPDRWNLLLVTVDTLRPDHLGAYGSHTSETPAIDRLAREGVRFDAAYAAVPLTLPSHSTIFTGLLPTTHGVRDNGGFRLEPTRSTLAGVLKANGYRTSGFVSAFVLDSRWGISNGFDDYYDQFPVSVGDLAAMARVQRPGGETWAHAREWLDAHGGDRFFVWLHLFDPHTPYDPPDPFRTRFEDHPYDGEIAYADSIVGEAIASLRAKGLLDRTLVAVVSDHGEGLGEHGEDEHGLLAYDSTLHVPWIMRLPGGQFAGTIVSQPVGLVDLMPTLLDLLGVPVVGGLDGASVARFVRTPQSGGADVLYAETLYPRLRFGWSELVSVRDARFKLLRGSRPELFEYRSDADETANVADRFPDAVRRLEQIVSKVTAKQSRAPSPSRRIDGDAATRLQALGYFAGSSPPTTSGALADPRDKAAAYRELTDVRRRLGGDDDGGLRAIQALLSREPELEPAHKLFRDVSIARRRFDPASRWLHERLRARPDDPYLLVDLAAIERASGRPAQALASATRAVEIRHDDVQALTIAGELQRDLRRFDTALDTFARASAASPGDLSLQVQIAQTLATMGRTGEADAALDRVLATDAQAAGVHYLRAQIAEQRRDRDAAEREYRAEIANSPWDYRARFNLAHLVGERGAHDEEVELLESIPRLAPDFADIHFFLAKALLDTGDRAKQAAAIDTATRGIRLAPRSPNAPLGHYVLADVYRLQGRAADAAREMAQGRALQRRNETQGK